MTMLPWVISAGIIAIHPVGENSQCAYDAAATPYLPWQLYIYVLYIYVCIICIIYIYMYYIYIYTTNQLSSYIYIYMYYMKNRRMTEQKKRRDLNEKHALILRCYLLAKKDM